MNESVLMLTLMAGIGLGTPLVFGTVGEILTERSGILNLGVQGIMLFGAVAGFWATFVTESLWLGVLAALVAGAGLSVIHAFNSVTLRVSQIVSGLALTIFGTGLSTFIGKSIEGKPLEGIWYDRTLQYEATRRGKEVDPEAFIERYELQYHDPFDLRQ